MGRNRYLYADAVDQLLADEQFTANTGADINSSTASTAAGNTLWALTDHLGPRVLKPHQRGQVAHIVSTYDGAKAFANAAPPAEWLCVFDPQCRFERPRRLDYMTPDSAMIDPFALYGLDFDEIPQRSGDDSFFPRKEVPSGAWDVFAINDLDRQDLLPENLPAVRAHSSLYIPALPARLSCLGTWIANVANQAAAVWWVVRELQRRWDAR